MGLKLRSLELAIEYTTHFPTMMQNNPDVVLDTARKFMAYLEGEKDNSTQESLPYKSIRNPSKNGQPA